MGRRSRTRKAEAEAREARAAAQKVIPEMPDELLVQGQKPKPKPKEKPKEQKQKTTTRDSDETRQERNPEEPLIGSGGGQYYNYWDVEQIKVSAIKKWTLFIGFTMVRLLSPLFLVIHTVSVLWFMWKTGFVLSEAKVAGQPRASELFIPLLANLGLVQFLNKQVFKCNYYKPRSEELR